VPQSPLSPLERALISEIVIPRVAQDPGFAFEQVVLAFSPTGPLRRSLGTLVAYGECGPSTRASQGVWPRRTWWVPADPDHRPQWDAVSPAGLVAGQASPPVRTCISSEICDCVAPFPVLKDND